MYICSAQKEGRIVEKERYCRECGSRYQGRIDKVFCCDQCRTNFHNARRREELRASHSVDTILMRNRRILDARYSLGRKCIPKKELQASRFDFRYYTSRLAAPLRRVRYACYEYTYYISLTGNVHLSRQTSTLHH